MPIPSASKLELAMLCPASAVLPIVDRLTPAAEKGNAIHDYMRNLASMSRESALARVPPEYRERCEAIDVSHLPLRQAEVALAYDVQTETTRLIGYDVHRRLTARGARRLRCSCRWTA